VLRIGRSTFYDWKNKILLKILELKLLSNTLLCLAYCTLMEVPTASSCCHLGKFVLQWAQQFCCFVVLENLYRGGHSARVRANAQTLPQGCKGNFGCRGGCACHELLALKSTTYSPACSCLVMVHKCAE
jgi:hypothetical protein